MRATTRYYDSSIGRFISEDPALDGYNWYAYCGVNPINRWDPSGMFWYEVKIGWGIYGETGKAVGQGFGNYWNDRYSEVTSFWASPIQSTKETFSGGLDFQTLKIMGSDAVNSAWGKITKIQNPSKYYTKQGIGGFVDLTSTLIKDGHEAARYKYGYDYVGPASEALATMAVTAGIAKAGAFLEGKLAQWKINCFIAGTLITTSIGFIPKWVSP